ncbi:MAG: peptidoglycan recognition family protein [Niameybacter sp.]
MDLNIQQHLLTPNPYSRPQLPLTKVKKLVIHWVANPTTSALANRNYFDNLKAGTRGVYASSHYIVGLQGEILQCIPHNEQAYHAKNANQYSLGIEVCHLDWEGAFNELTYSALIRLLTKLCHTYTLDPQQDLLRHYDVTGKVCPKFYVQHPAFWTRLKADVTNTYRATYLTLSPTASPTPTSIPLLLNGVVKPVLAFLEQEQYYVRLRDLADQQLLVDYDKVQHMPLLCIKENKTH